MKKIKFFPQKKENNIKNIKLCTNKKNNIHKKENKTLRAHRLTKPAVVLRAHIFGQNDKFRLKFRLL